MQAVPSRTFLLRVSILKSCKHKLCHPCVFDFRRCFYEPLGGHKPNPCACNKRSLNCQSYSPQSDGRRLCFCGSPLDLWSPGCRSASLVSSNLRNRETVFLDFKRLPTTFRRPQTVDLLQPALMSGHGRNYPDSMLLLLLQD